MNVFSILLVALLLDQWLGEPGRWHPLVGFGRLAGGIEARLNRPGGTIIRQKAVGLLAWLVGCLPVVLLLVQIEPGLMDVSPRLAWLYQVAIVYLAIGRKSLHEHAQAILAPLQQGDMAQAREKVGLIVSRDTAELDAEAIARATTESVLENGNDAVFAAVFWFVVAGLPGVVLYRLANTLDAMWGYKNERFFAFGWAAARLDDLLNYLPARLTALSYAVAGQTRQALSCWRVQAGQWKSPNAGPVMAAGAGAINVCLGGAAVYHQQAQQRPLLGAGQVADAGSIVRALSLLDKALFYWLLVIFAVEVLIC